MKFPIFNSKVTHDDVSKAVSQFLNEGGTIVCLPEQKSQDAPVIGGEKYEEFESLASIVST